MDDKTPTVVKDDRPYAGILSLAVGVNQRHRNKFDNTQVLDEKELSVLRHQLFFLLGSSDDKYSKHKSNIIDRKENNRFSDLSKLINKGTVKLIDKDSRSVHRLRKNKRKEK